MELKPLRLDSDGGQRLAQSGDEGRPAARVGGSDMGAVAISVSVRGMDGSIERDVRRPVRRAERAVHFSGIDFTQQQRSKPEALLGLHVLLQRAGQAVAERHDAAGTGRDLKRRADARELFDDQLERAVGAQPKRDHAADCFEVAAREVAAFAELGEDFEFGVGAQVNGDLHVHVAEGRHLANAQAADNLRQIARLERRRRFHLARHGFRFGMRGDLPFVTFLQRHRLAVAATVAIDRDAFARVFVRQPVDFLDVFHRGRLWEIDGLADGRVAVPLEAGLHFHVPVGRDVVGADEDAFDVVGHAVEMHKRSDAGQGFEEFIREEAALLGEVAKRLVDLEQRLFALLLAFEDVSEEREREHRLDAAGAVGDDADGSGGRDGGAAGVAHHAVVPRLPDAALPVGEAAALAGEVLAVVVGLVVDELHEAPAPFDAFVTVVGGAELVQRVGEAHDAQADLSVALADLVDLGQRVLVGVDDVVEEAGRDMHRLAQRVPVHLGLGHARVADELPEIDAAEVAGFVRQKRLLAAGVGGLDPPDVRRGVFLVDAVHEDHAGLAGLPGVVDDDFPDFVFGVDLALQAL